MGKLEKILKFKPLKDEKGEYVPFCNYHWHRGLIRFPEKCERLKCSHYYKFYLQK